MIDLEQVVTRAREKVSNLNLDAEPWDGDPRQSVSLSRTSRGLGRIIEHTNLKADASPSEIRRLCAEAKSHEFFGVCVHPNYVKLAKDELAGSRCKVVTVLGFPLGATVTEAKIAELEACPGADEFDMVPPLGLLKAGLYQEVFEDCRAVVRAAGNRPVKVILETGLLDRDQVAVGCLLAASAGAQFVKTSTGFGPRGASVEDIWLMRSCVGDRLGLKAAGGITEYRSARILVEAGAQRIGSSSSVDLIHPAARR